MIVSNKHCSLPCPCRLVREGTISVSSAHSPLVHHDGSSVASNLSASRIGHTSNQLMLVAAFSVRMVAVGRIIHGNSTLVLSVTVEHLHMLWNLLMMHIIAAAAIWGFGPQCLHVENGFSGELCVDSRGNRCGAATKINATNQEIRAVGEL